MLSTTPPPLTSQPVARREDRRLRPRSRGWVALLPLLLLALLMAGFGLLMGDFSKIPMTIVFTLTAIAALSIAFAMTNS